MLHFLPQKNGEKHHVSSVSSEEFVRNRLTFSSVCCAASGITHSQNIFKATVICYCGEIFSYDISGYVHERRRLSPLSLPVEISVSSSKQGRSLSIVGRQRFRFFCTTQQVRQQDNERERLLSFLLTICPYLEF